MNKIAAKIMPFIGLAIFILLFVLGLVFFFYLFIIALVIGAIAFAIAYIRARFFQTKSKSSKKTIDSPNGRIIEHEDL